MNNSQNKIYALCAIAIAYGKLPDEKCPASVLAQAVSLAEAIDDYWSVDILRQQVRVRMLVSWEVE
ncbi:MAG: hypothetical protein QNJ46_27410 [Leptolyngbyaceae cyanobacterium MO_188.B28]|nr:hypothetical protein [Leptolyngbyaceae cyanobacterium MO_188.B28]